MTIVSNIFKQHDHFSKTKITYVFVFSLTFLSVSFARTQTLALTVRFRHRSRAHASRSHARRLRIADRTDASPHSGRRAQLGLHLGVLRRDAGACSVSERERGIIGSATRHIFVLQSAMSFVTNHTRIDKIRIEYRRCVTGLFVSRHKCVCLKCVLSTLNYF